MGRVRRYPPHHRARAAGGDNRRHSTLASPNLRNPRKSSRRRALRGWRTTTWLSAGSLAESSRRYFLATPDHQECTCDRLRWSLNRSRGDHKAWREHAPILPNRVLRISSRSAPGAASIAGTPHGHHTSSLRSYHAGLTRSRISAAVSVCQAMQSQRATRAHGFRPRGCESSSADGLVNSLDISQALGL
jgi:hypothetical protein